jgi:hypothetical protein
VIKSNIIKDDFDNTQKETVIQPKQDTTLAEEKLPLPGLFSLLNKKIPIKNPISEIPAVQGPEEVKEDPTVSPQVL